MRPAFFWTVHSRLCHFFGDILCLQSGTDGRILQCMKIAKPLLLLTTPLGVIGAVHEAFRLAGGLGFLMLALISYVAVSVGTLVVAIRKEQRAAAAAAKSALRGDES